MISKAQQPKKTLLTIIQCLWVISFLLVFLTVFIVNGDLANGVISGKYFWFLRTMGLLSLFTLVFCFTEKISFKYSFQDFLVCFFAFSLYTSSLFINNGSISVTKLTIFTLLVVLYFYFRLIYHTNIKYAFPSFCIFIIITGFIEAIWGLCQLYGWSDSYHSHFLMTGSFFNPGIYAGYLAVVFPVSLYTFLSKKEGLYESLDCFVIIRIFSGISCVVILFVLPASMSRTAWIATLVSSIAVLLLYLKNKRIKRNIQLRYRKYIIVFLVICPVLIYSLYSLKKDSVNGRFLIWKVVIQMIPTYPLGVGLGNFSGIYGNTQVQYLNSHAKDRLIAENTNYAFNEYLQILAESGIVSFLLFAMIIITALHNMLKTNNLYLFSALISLLLLALFSYPFSNLPFLIILMFLLGSSIQEVSEDNSKSYRILLFTLSTFCLVVFCIIDRYPAYLAYQKWKNNRELFAVNNYHEAVKNYKPLYPFLYDQIEYLFEYAQSLSKSEQFTASNIVLERAIQMNCDPMLYILMGKNYQALKLYNKAEHCFLKASQIVPNRIYPHYLLAKLYAEIGLIDKSKEAAFIVINQHPKIPSIAVTEMKNEMKQLTKMTK
jgi:tetratricopeptide (TPR) repeat protein